MYRVAERRDCPHGIRELEPEHSEGRTANRPRALRLLVGRPDPVDYLNASDELRLARRIDAEE